MKEFLKLLSLLRDALVHFKDEELKMKNYYENLHHTKGSHNFIMSEKINLSNQSSTHLHNCGTAACVAGYGALYKPLREYLHERSGIEELTIVNICFLITFPVIEYGFNIPSIINRINPNVIINSICRSEKNTRLCDIDNQRIFTLEEMKSFNHLQKDEPTIGDAIEYIEAVITRLEEIDKE